MRKQERSFDEDQTKPSPSMESSVADVTSYGPGSEALIQRCVIVQRDQRGYGLTVSGDNPVRIQSVKEDGAASKAGVQEGDTIIKVNGSLVTSSNHSDVVKLIKAAGSYVALTLLGKQPPPAPSGSIAPVPSLPSTMDETRNITAPSPASDDTSRQYSAERVDTLKHMLESEKVMFLELQAKYTDNPTEKLKKELASVRNRIKLLEAQVSNAESIPGIRLPVHDAVNDNVPTQVERRPSDWLPQGAHHQRQVSNPDNVIYSQINPRDVESSNIGVKRNRSDAQEFGKRMKPSRRGAVRQTDERKRRSNELEKSKSLPMDSEQDDDEEARNRASTIGGGIEDSREGNIESMNLLNPTPSNPTSDMFKPAPFAEPHNKQIMAMEDEFTSDQEMFDEPGPFDRLEELEKKPAHLAVFLHYLISNSDPSSLFFYMVTESYKDGSHKDMKRWSYEIFSTFIAENAPMKVEGVTKDTVESIESEMSTQNLPEDKLRQLFTVAQGQAVSEVLELLAEFRRNRSLGLGSIFGDQWLTQENMDRHQEIKIVEQILMPHLERLMSTNIRLDDKSQALASALGTFMRQVGVKVHGNSSLDRVASFTNKDKKKGTRPKRKTQQNRGNKQHKGHQFQETHYTSTAFCGACNGLLWGIGNQGMRCQDCELNIHKNDVCMEKLVDHCQGKSRKPRVSGIRGRIPVAQMKNRLPMFGAKGDEPEKTGVTSPGALSPTIVERLENEDEEIESLKNTGRVNNIITHFKNEYDSPTSVHTDSVVSTQSGDELSVGTVGEGAVPRGTNLNRSSSLKATGERRNKGRGGERRSKSDHPDSEFNSSKDDVDMDQHAIMASQSYMGSASSLSGKSAQLYLQRLFRSQESLSSMSETRTYTDDSDMEAEQDTPNWSKAVDKDIVKKLKPKEVRRQEIINELFHTEKTHVRNLKVLDKVFYQPMLNELVLPKETVMYLFPNLPSLLEEHGTLNAWMKKEKKTSHVVQDVGNLLLQRFDGEAGETMKRVSAEFCSNQRHALELLKAKQKKDPKLASFIEDAEGQPLCRRLPLRGIISTQMQRLTKYPLFIQNLLKYSQPRTDDYAKLERALECCKELLDYVNQAVREADNRHRLSEIKQKTDTTAYDRVTKTNQDEVSVNQIFHKLLYDSPVTWKLSRNKSLEMHAMLMEDFVVLLQKQDDKYILKFHSTSSAVPLQQNDVNVSKQRNTHSPIIRLSTTLCRQVATSKKAFFLISTSGQGPQIYELVAPSVTERKTWMELIAGAQDNIKRKGSGKGTMRVTLPSRPHYHHEGDEDRNENISNLSGERAESTEVVLSKPVVVEHVVAFPTVAEEEQGDATTLLKKALDETVGEEADTRKASEHIKLVLSRVIRVGKEKGVDQLMLDALEKCHNTVKRFQTLHNEEMKQLEEEIDSELNAKNEMKEEIQRLRLVAAQHMNNGGVQGNPTAISEESIVTDLDHADTDPDTAVNKNRHSYSAESNSSATDESDGIDQHDYEEVTDGPEPIDSYSGDSSENTPQPQVLKVQPQVATEVVNTQLYNLQSGIAESVENFVPAVAVEVQASCIQAESAYSEQELATKMNSMNLAAESTADSSEDGMKPSPDNIYWALPEAEKEFTPIEGRTSVGTYEEVGPVVTEEQYSLPPETVAASGDLSSATESISSLGDETSSSCAVEFTSSGQPEGGAEESSETKSSKQDESGSTSTSSSSGSSSRPASMVSADSGSEDIRGDHSSTPDGKDSEDSDDQTIQVMPTENPLELVADGDDEDGALTGSQEGHDDMTEEPPQCISTSEGGTDVDNPARLPGDLVIDESLPESSTSKTEEIQCRDINLNQNNVTEEMEDAPSSQETSETEVLKVVEEHDSKDDEETTERRVQPPLPVIPAPIPPYPDILSFDSDSDDYEQIV